MVTVRRSMTCKAAQYSDQMVCECGQRWDINDPHPPNCLEFVPTVKVCNDGHDAYLLIETDGRWITISESQLDRFIREVMVQGNQLRREQYLSKPSVP